MNFQNKIGIISFEIKNITNPKLITNNNISLIDIILSPRLICRLGKGKNYKFTNINYNYQSISRSHKRNTSFSNTNNNYRDYSLNNICSVEVER